MKLFSLFRKGQCFEVMNANHCFFVAGSDLNPCEEYGGHRHLAVYVTRVRGIMIMMIVMIMIMLMITIMIMT